MRPRYYEYTSVFRSLSSTSRVEKTVGGRSAADYAFEDKTLYLGIWCATEVRHAPEAVVAVAQDALQNNVILLNQSAGTM